VARQRRSIVDSFAGVELSPGLAEMLSPAGMKNFLGYAAIVAGNRWIAKWLPKRWDRMYAVNVLRADPGGDGIPFFSKGRMILQAAQARARVRVMGQAAELRITIPAGSLNFHPRQVKAFKTLPPNERLDIQSDYRRGLDLAVREAMRRKASRSSSLAGGRSATLSIGQAQRALLRASRERGVRSSLALGQQLASRRAQLFAERRAMRQQMPAMTGNAVVDAGRRLPVTRASADGSTLARRKWFLRSFTRISRRAS
jgi:hypothetical protein